MDILWHGQLCFEIRISSNQAEKKIIVIAPFSKNTGLKLPSLTADILLIPYQYSGQEEIKVIKGTPFLIDGPGEYEVKGVFVRGVAGLPISYQEKDLTKNTIFIFEIEGIKLCHLGNLNQEDITPEQLEVVGEVDILMVPIGGGHTINVEAAQKIINQIEPKIIIPMQYDLPGLERKIDSLRVFLKTMGQEETESRSVLKIKKQGLPTETKIIVLKP